MGQKSKHRSSRRYRELEDERRVSRITGDSRYDKGNMWKDKSVRALIAVILTAIVVGVVFVLSTTGRCESSAYAMSLRTDEVRSWW